MARRLNPGEVAVLSAYTALTPINHNGEDVKPGGVLELTEAEAAALLACNPPAIAAEAKAEEPSE